MAQHENNEWIGEDDIAKSLNVDREKIRAQRPYLGPGEVEAHGKSIVWLRSAAERVAASLGLAMPSSAQKDHPVDSRGLLAEKNAPASDFEELTVISTPGKGGYHFANPHIIRARRPTGEAVLVRVVDSRKYVPKMRNGEPMVLKAKPAEAGLWWIPTGREPRYTGVW